MTRPSNKANKARDLRVSTPLEEAQFFSIPDGARFDAKFEVRSPETPAERASRHKKEAREFWVKDAPIYLLAGIIGIAGLVASLVMTFRVGSSIEEKRWAMSILSHLLIAVASFAFGKAAT
jgi:hypothetical protein